MRTGKNEVKVLSATGALVSLLCTWPDNWFCYHMKSYKSSDQRLPLNKNWLDLKFWFIMSRSPLCLPCFEFMGS